jgi:hypothetical protein
MLWLQLISEAGGALSATPLGAAVFHRFEQEAAEYRLAEVASFADAGGDRVDFVSLLPRRVQVRRWTMRATEPASRRPGPMWPWRSMRRNALRLSRVTFRSSEGNESRRGREVLTLEK